jgi:hypothetical protein
MHGGHAMRSIGVVRDGYTLKTCPLDLCHNSPQSRHPERSAARICRIADACGAESKDPGGANSYQCPSGLFGHGARAQPRAIFVFLANEDP